MSRSSGVRFASGWSGAERREVRIGWLRNGGPLLRPAMVVENAGQPLVAALDPVGETPGGRTGEGRQSGELTVRPSFALSSYPVLAECCCGYRLRSAARVKVELAYGPSRTLGRLPVPPAPDAPN